MVFVDQSFWQVGIAAKPQHGVWGFLTGAAAYFSLPLAISYALGMAYWALLVDSDATVFDHTIPDEGFLNGKPPSLGWTMIQGYFFGVAKVTFLYTSKLS